MRLLFAACSFTLLFCSCSPSIKYYVVRHAEKAGSTTGMDSRDPQLSEAGKQRATALAQTLSGKKIRQVFVTSTIRSKATAAPTSALFSLTPEIYPAMPDTAFTSRIRSLKSSSLIVGHSNTVDDLVNSLMGKPALPGDLSDLSFDRLFIITRKGNRYTLLETRYGAPTP